MSEMSAVMHGQLKEKKKKDERREPDVIQQQDRESRT